MSANHGPWQDMRGNSAPADLDGERKEGGNLPVFQRFGKILLVLAMILASAGPSVVLQAVAWTRMLAGNL
jgi:hypothetical protein